MLNQNITYYFYKYKQKKFPRKVNVWYKAGKATDKLFPRNRLQKIAIINDLLWESRVNKKEVI